MSESRICAAAMSGGVDSSAAAHLLRLGGYDVRGVTFRMHCLPGTEDPVPSAEAVCRALSVPHTAIDATTEFSHSVMADFIREYTSGRTPNPCVICNRTIKFPLLCRFADTLSSDTAIATGHYARLIRCGSRIAIAKAADPAKDQSYMLWQLPQEILARLLLPLGDYTKAQIREIAAEANLPSAASRDSQDICFIPDGDYTKFLADSGVSLMPGTFADESGTVLGPSKNQAAYTIGQRRGLGIALGHHMFVTARDAAQNRVTISPTDPYAKTVRASSAVCMAASPEDLASPRRVTVKLRYTRAEFPCTAVLENGILTVTLDEMARAPAPGQSLVLYDGETVVAGGIIDTWEA
ncbi:MAG: tRNA 2-thiouridine(34) synthase MnmA [Clostridia bacterium]|nr:tRNA 2-thiouridine(34) synthase MnmA [Clostridia bacterium]